MQYILFSHFHWEIMKQFSQADSFHRHCSTGIILQDRCCTAISFHIPLPFLLTSCLEEPSFITIKTKDLSSAFDTSTYKNAF